MIKKNTLLLIGMLIAAFCTANAQSVDTTKGVLGINWQIDEATKFPKIYYVTAGMPADLSHLQPNDYITVINGQSTYGMSIEDLNNSLDGDIGSTCYITVWRNNVNYPISFIRTRPYPDWEADKIDSYYHIQATDKLNVWSCLPGYRFVSPGRLNDLRTIWQPGLRHPDFNIIASASEGYWTPIFGYYYMNPNTPHDFTTSWKSGVKHPYYNIISTNIPEQWVPLPGFRYIYSNSLDVVWTPGLRYQSLKIISCESENTFRPFPGYVFRYGSSLAVVWRAGQPKPGDPSKVSGYREGIWVDKTQPDDTNSAAQDNTAAAIVEFGAATVLEYLIGDNFISDYLYEQAEGNVGKVITSSL